MLFWASSFLLIISTNTWRSPSAILYTYMTGDMTVPHRQRKLPIVFTLDFVCDVWHPISWRCDRHVTQQHFCSYSSFSSTVYNLSASFAVNTLKDMSESAATAVADSSKSRKGHAGGPGKKGKKFVEDKVSKSSLCNHPQELN